MLIKSILDSTKSKLGVMYNEFDNDIIIEINSALAILTEAGVGPKSGFTIESSEATWDDLTTQKTLQSLCKQYIWIRCRMTFDPPTNSFLSSALQDQEQELIWRINVLVDSPPPEDQGDLWTD